VAQSIAVLTEWALSEGDAERIVALHTPQAPTFHVLVPAGLRGNVLVEVLDHLSLLEFKEAVQAVEGRPERTPSEAEADVRASVEALQGQGVSATGEVVTGEDPIAALADAVAQGADEVVIVTEPHLVEDTLHRDWASVARDRLGVPVLHVYRDSSWVG
jgi:hypothetical protein